MAQLQSLRLFVNERLTMAVVDILGVVEKVVTQYQEEICRSKEENEQLRRLLRITPEIRLCRVDSLQLSLADSEEDTSEFQGCKEEWNPSLGLVDQNPTHIKEEQDELRTNLDVGYHQGLFETQTQTVENRETDSKPMDDIPFGTVTHLKVIHIPYVPPEDEKHYNNHNSSDNPVGLKVDSMINPGDKALGFADRRKRLKQNGKPSNHNIIHTEKKRFRCGDCGKSFNRRGHLTEHVQTHTGEKPFSCGNCGKRFNRKRNLNVHLLTHTREQQFNCRVCGKIYKYNRSLIVHMQTHKLLESNHLSVSMMPAC
uniref:C2H2-type domain-containing protein n=1 Tax=Esox lucius TaxID=8010 RepID=A0A3P9ALR3_ESOLU